MRWSKRLVASREVLLAVRDSGGDGVPVVLIHGLGTVQRSWDRVAPRLSPRCRVVTYDQRGHGRSSTSADYSIDALVGDLATVIAACQIEQPVLVGHSIGALVAVEGAANVECRAVVAVDGALPMERPAAAKDRRTFDAETRSPLARALTSVATLAGAAVRLSNEQMWQLTVAAEDREHAVDAVYDRLSCPVLQVLAANADPVAWGHEMLAARIAAAQQFRQAHPTVVQIWLDSGHAIPLQRPAELADHIINLVA